jgi:hypothetical protein
VRQALPMIDDFLQIEQRDLPSRPMVATDMFIDHFIAEGINIDLKSAERYLESWYAVIFAIVSAWYKGRYGTALHTRPSLVGVVEIHGLPFRVNVPENYAEPNPEQGISDLCFGPSVGASESPRNWIVTPPSLEALSSRASARLDRDLALVTKLLRTTTHKFMMADPAPKLFQQHRGAALSALRKAADLIATRGPGDVSSAEWEVHFALESAIKAAISQTGVEPPVEHQLSKLLKFARASGTPLELSRPLGFLPGWRGAVDLRHGATLNGGYREAMRIYRTALPLVAEIATKLRYSLTLSEGARITLKRPPWIEYMEPSS